MTEFVPKSDIMGVGDIVELYANRAVVENDRGRQYIFSEDTYRNANLDLTKLFKLNDKIVYKADHRIITKRMGLNKNVMTKKIYVATFVRKLDDCFTGQGVICELHPTYGIIKSKSQEKKIFFPAMAFADARSDIFYNKVKDCTKFFRVNDVVTYVAVEENVKSKCIYGISFDIRLNEDPEKPRVGIVIDITKDYCRVWVKHHDVTRINGNEICPGLMDVKKVIELGSRIEFSCPKYPKVEKVRLLDDYAKIRLDNYKKYLMRNKKTQISDEEETKEYYEKDPYEGDDDDEIKLVEDFDDNNCDNTTMCSSSPTSPSSSAAAVVITIRSLGTVKTVKPTYAVLYNEKVGNVLILVSDWARKKKIQTNDFDMTTVLNTGEVLYFEGYFYRGTNKDGYRADRVEKTYSGKGVISRIHQTYGFLHSSNLDQEIFFAGSALVDDFCGLKNLDKTLRLGDEVRYCAILESSTDKHEYSSSSSIMRYKAVAVVIPPMGNENCDNCVGIVTDVNSSGATIYCRPLGDVHLIKTMLTPTYLIVGHRLRFTCRRLGTHYEAIGHYDILPDDFVLKFPVYSSAPQAAAANGHGDGVGKYNSVTNNNNGEFENKINMALEINGNDGYRRRDSDENHNFSNPEDVIDLGIGDDFARNGDDVESWSDLEKELDNLAMDVCVQQQHRSLSAEMMDENDSRKVIKRPPTCDIFGGPQSTANYATDDIYKRIRSYSNELFNSNSLFTPIFVNSPFVQQQTSSSSCIDKEIWPQNSHSTCSELSQTQTSANDELVAQSALAAPPKSFASKCSSPINFVDSPTMVNNSMDDDNAAAAVVVVVKKDVNCQASFNEESDLLKELMKDDDIFKFVASKNPSWMYKWCLLQRR